MNLEELKLSHQSYDVKFYRSVFEEEASLNDLFLEQDIVQQVPLEVDNYMTLIEIHLKAFKNFG